MVPVAQVITAVATPLAMVAPVVVPPSEIFDISSKSITLSFEVAVTVMLSSPEFSTVNSIEPAWPAILKCVTSVSQYVVVFVSADAVQSTLVSVLKSSVAKAPLTLACEIYNPSNNVNIVNNCFIIL